MWITHLVLLNTLSDTCMYLSFTLPSVQSLESQDEREKTPWISWRNLFLHTQEEEDEEEGKWVMHERVFSLSLFSVVFEFDSSCFCLRSFFLAVLQHHDHEPPSFTSICLRSLNLEFSFAKLFEKKRLVEGRASSSIALNFPALLLLRSKQNLSITWKKRYPFLRSWTLVSSWTCRSCKEIPWDKQSPFNSQGSIWELFSYRFCYAVCCARTRLRLDLTSSVLRELWRDFSFDSWLACLFSSE